MRPHVCGTICWLNLMHVAMLVNQLIYNERTLSNFISQETTIPFRKAYTCVLYSWKRLCHLVSCGELYHLKTYHNHIFFLNVHQSPSSLTRIVLILYCILLILLWIYVNFICLDPLVLTIWGCTFYKYKTLYEADTRIYRPERSILT